MKNRKLLLIVSLVLAMTMSLGGTLAYLQDQDADVNTMVLGNVTITQNEQEWNADKTELVEFNQDKPMLPVVGDVAYNEYDENPEIRRLTMNNVVDKYVSVTNTGKSDAYVRTLIALEMGSKSLEELGEILSANINKADGDEFDFSGTWLWPTDAVFTIDDEKYNVMVAVHENPVKPGETTIPSLLQVYLKSNATNQDLIDLDGNENGKYDILVLSQAVQADGFAADSDRVAAQVALDTAFGVVNQDNVAEWFKGWAQWGKEEIGTPGNQWPNNNPPSEETPVVTNNDELKEAIEAGETEIVMKAGTYHMPDAAKGKTLKLMGTKDTIIEVVPCNTPGAEANGQLDYSLDGSTVTFEGLTIKTNSQLYAGFARLSGTYNNCTIQNTYNLGVGNSVFNDCTFNITNEYLRVGGANSAVFNGCTFNTDGRAILVFQDGTSDAQTVTVKDCTFNATAAANTWNGIHVAAVSIDGTNGTYTVNLEGNNTVDSDFNGLWQIKTGEANVTVNE